MGKPEKKSAVGIDLSKKKLIAVRMYANQQKDEWLECSTDGAGLESLYQFLHSDDTVALETGTMAFLIARQIQKRIGCLVLPLNAGDLALIHRSLKKNDASDAKKLARLALWQPESELPVVAIPSEKEEERRALNSHLEFMTQNLTRFKNRLHAIFHSAGIVDITRKDLARPEIRQMRILDLPAHFIEYAAQLDLLLKTLETQIAELKKKMRASLCENTETSKILLSMPGIGPTAAFAYGAYIGDGARFTRPEQVSYYLGLVPRLYQSGQTTRHGHIVKRGCAAIRSALVQSAWALLRTREDFAQELKSFYSRIAGRRGRKIAIVALARKMGEILYTMLRSRTTFQNISEDYLLKKYKLYGLTT
jgi:transposase